MTNQEIFHNAEILFKEKDYTQTLLTLMKGFIADNQHVPFYQLAGKALRGLKGYEEAEMFERAIKAFTDWQAFYDLGYHYVEMGYWDLAIAFLARANTLNPADVVVAYEYSLALGARFRLADALHALRMTDFASEFWAAYRAFHLSVLLGQDIAEAKIFLRNIREQIYLKTEIADDEAFALQKLDNLQEIIGRYEALETPETHIRDWHFIQYGAAVLDFFEEKEEDIQVAGGRWVAAWASEESLRNLLEKLKAFCEMSALSFEKILYIADRDAEITAKLIGKILHLPTEKLTNDNVLTNNTLVVADAADKFNDWKQLAVKRKGQVTFAIWQSWLEDVAFCPDVVGVLAQMYNLPWEGGAMRLVDAENQTFERTEPNFQNPDAIAKYISEIVADLSEDVFFEENIAFYQKYQALWAGKTKTNRFYFTAESPITGSFFQ